jgi:hypothetical protein
MGQGPEPVEGQAIPWERGRRRSLVRLSNAPRPDDRCAIRPRSTLSQTLQLGGGVAQALGTPNRRKRINLRLAGGDFCSDPSLVKTLGDRYW